MIYIVLTVSAILAAGYFFFFKKKSEEKAVEIETLPLVEEVKEEPITNIEVVVEKVEETSEQLKERLDKMISEDSNKPFANLSKPSASEIPNEILSESSEISDVAEAGEVKKKKRPYKRKPRKKVEKKED